ncbi:GTPase/DUF3482 domain-containing protein [Sinimarinibacterium thermocellulolyticum]|uniref:GTPase/DUF3482 domain-containing protein n=1 Tax=Sinimarinibacterium thermocellulolyticum TaxID=3170016 RepID=A0ABV2A9D6_9GAMM
MNGAKTIEIAVVGHTNTGKTSLLRTLSRDTRFGEVSDRPATTRDVRGVLLLADGEPVVALYDTPGLEDAMGVSALLAEQHADAADPVAAVEVFLAGDHGNGRYEQEAKVLRQMLRSDAALYVVDAREPVRAKHREELRLLAACGKPLLPVLNFVASGEADAGTWRAQLARLGLHVLAEFDTVVYDARAERSVFERLASLLEDRRADFERLQASREREREALIDAACRAVAELLVDAAGARRHGALDADSESLHEQLRDAIRGAEQRCVDTLLGLFRFELDAYIPPALPLQQGRWQLDAFDPQTLRHFGIRTGSAAAAGGAAGLAVDAAVGGMSLGAAALLGAGIGAGWSALRSFGQPWLDRLRGEQRIALEEPTLALLAARQCLLLRALLRRGHASQDRVHTDTPQGWPSEALRQAVLRCRAHPEWSRLNGSADGSVPAPVLRHLVASVRALLN